MGERARARHQAAWTVLAAATSAVLAWLGLTSFAWNDYDNEARASMTALVHGHLHEFFQLAPAYGGSLLERAPFALAPDLWGGGEMAVYRMLALPCLLAGAALGLWLVERMRRDGLGPPARLLALLLCTANPLVLVSLEIGHPDDLLGGVLCVAAVLLAARGRGGWAAMALGLAIANKQWALLAVGPVLLALPAARARCMTVTAAVAAVVLAPFALLGADRFASAVHGAATHAGGLFQPWQVWWFLGRRVDATTLTAKGAEASSRMAPHWVETLSHPLILALAVPLTWSAWRGMRAAGRTRAGATTAVNRQDPALVLLALLLLTRCVLDPWDNVYYPIPFVLALMAWETLSLARAPLLAFAATVAVWGGHHWMATFASEDDQAAFFIAWSVPLAIALAVLSRRGVATRRDGQALADDRELLGKLREHLVPVLGDGHQVLDSHT